MYRKMKRALVIALTAIAAAIPAINAGTPVKPAQLPKAAQTFISTHFPADDIRKVEMDRGFRGVEYEVDMVSGAEIEFRDNGEWKEVKAAKGNALPTGVVPARVAEFVAKNFPGQSVKEISRKRGGYEVELTNDTEFRLAEDGIPL